MPILFSTLRRLAILLSLMLAAACTHPDTALLDATPSPAPPSDYPTLDDFWNGTAEFVMTDLMTGLPMGESDTVLLPDGRLWSYVHASHQSAGVLDQCGDPVPFPGCLVLLESQDYGRNFTYLEDDGVVRCQMPCASCPCTSQRDHIDQQQYPRIVTTGAGSGAERWWMAYEYRANTFLSRSPDGLTWADVEEVPLTGIWNSWLMPCRPEERIGPHPYAPPVYDCLVGAPPGLHLVDEGDSPELFLFVGLGQNPSSMGCYRGPADGPAVNLRKCSHNPLFTGALDYGPLDDTGPATNPYFDFRTISSADLLKVGPRYYLFYEGVRGPGPGDDGDTQFTLGLARSLTDAIDGPWELYPGNPILIDQPGNVGVGHADVLVVNGQTLLFTSLDGEHRSRLVLRRPPDDDGGK